MSRTPESKRGKRRSTGCPREGDLIVGRLSQSAIGTLVERRSRYLRLVHRPNGHSAEAHRAAMELVLASLPTEGLRTLTWDQGTEMAYHNQLTRVFSDGIYFARPASPWMRGTNENTNGLLRQYFPKRTDLRTYSLDDLKHAEQRLNNRPRKVLGWQTAAQVFAAASHTDDVSVATIARIRRLTCASLW